MSDKNFYDFARDFFGLRNDGKEQVLGHYMSHPRSCPKCGGQVLLVRWVAKAAIQTEYLACKCQTCEYNWTAPTEDAKK